MIDTLIYTALLLAMLYFVFKGRKYKRKLAKETIAHCKTKALLQQSETKKNYFKNLAFKRDK